MGWRSTLRIYYACSDYDTGLKSDLASHINLAGVTPARAEKAELNFDDNIQYTCMMKRIELLLIFIFGFLLTHAQQKIVFVNKNNNNSKSYSLPLSVTCTFKDGSKKRVILEKVIGDSLVFEKYYNQENNDCRFNSLKKIHLHKRGEIVLYTLFGTFLSSTVIFATAAGYLMSAPVNDPGDPSHSTGVLFIPVAAISGIGAVIFKNHLPRTYKTKDWELNEK